MTKWSRASLCLYSTTNSAAAVTQVLGLEPTSVHEMGDRRTGKNRRTGEIAEYAPYKTSAWIYDPDPSLVDPTDDSGFAALKALVRGIRDRADALATLRPDYQTVIRWSGEVSGQGNFAIDAATIVELGLLGCEFYGTAYPEEELDQPADVAD